MAVRIGVVSVHPVAMEVAAGAFSRLWPEAALHHVLDDRLFDRLRVAGAVEPGMTDVLAAHARNLRACGVDAVLFTCSAFHTCIASIAAESDVPVLGPNQAMIDAALAVGSRLVLLATVRATLTSLAEEIRGRAAGRAGLVLLPHFVPGAFDRLAAGDADGHDRLLLAAAERIEPADAVLLGQFTLARVRGPMQQKLRVPVLAAPDAAVQALRALLA